MNIRNLLSLTLLSGLAALSAQPAHTYEIDPVHSGVSFKVRHFFNQVPGKFTDFQGSVTFDPGDPSHSQATAVIKPASVDTSNGKRDGHLKTEDFFNVDKHQTIEFTSTKWEPNGKNEAGQDTYKVTGDLTMLGQTKPVTLDVVYLGEMEGQGPYEGVMIAGWEATGEIDRTQWGLNGGQPVVSKDVKIELSIQGHRPIDEPQANGGAGGK